MISRVAATLAVAGLSLGAGTVTALTATRVTPATGAALAQQDPPTAGLTIQLIEQQFSLEADSELRLVYRIQGDLEATADLTPTTTTTSTTTTTTTSTTTTVAPPDVGDPAVVDPPGVLDETIPATTLPPPREISVDVANFDPITDIEQASRLLGPTAEPGVFRGNIDGVRVTDARSTIEFVDQSTALLTVSIPTDTGGNDQLSGPDSLEFPAPGIYPIRVQLLVDNDLVGTHGTLVERLPGPADIQRPTTPVQFAIVTGVERSAGLDQVADIIEAAAAIDQPLLASIPPHLLTAAIAQFGDDALADDEIAALSDIDLDVSSAVAAGLDEQYTQALGRGEDAITEALSRPPTRLIRIVDEPISAPGAQLLRSIGVQALVMTPERYDDLIGGELPDTDRLIDVALPDDATLPLLLTDPLSNDFSTDAADAVLADHTTTEWAVKTIAAVILNHRSQGRTVRRTRVIGLDGLTPPDPRLINAFDAMAATTPDVTLIAPTALIGTTDTQRPPGTSGAGGIVLPAVAGTDLTARLADIDATTVHISSTASMLDGDDERFLDWTGRLEALLSTGVSDDEAAVVINGVIDESNAIRSAIALPEPFTFTLTGRSDTIPVRVRNTSNERLRVIVNLSSPKLSFPGNDRLVVLRPNDSTDLQVPVRARSNGTSPVSVQLLTPLGDPLGEPVSLTARVNSLTGLGQVLTGGFLLLLATWWIAHWRARRSDNTSDEATNLSLP